MKKAFYPIFLFLIAQNIEAMTLRECRQVGQNNQLNMEVQDQGYRGTCFANSATLLLQSEMGSHSLSFQHLALNYQSTISSGFVGVSRITDGGYVCDSLNAAFQNGVCSQSSFSFGGYRNFQDGLIELSAQRSFTELIDYIGARGELNRQEWTNLSHQLTGILAEQEQICEVGLSAGIENIILSNFSQAILQSLNGALEQEERSRDREDFPESIKEIQRDRIHRIESLRDELLTPINVSQNTDIIQWNLKPNIAQAIRENMQQFVDYAQIPFSERLISENIFGSPLRVISEAIGNGDDEENLSFVGGELIENRINELLERLRNCETPFSSSITSRLNLNILRDEPACFSPEIFTDQEIENAYDSAISITSWLQRKNLDDPVNRLAAFTELTSPQCANELSATQDLLRGKQCETFVVSSNVIAERGYNSIERPTSNRTNGARDWITERVCNNKPVAVAACLDFFTRGVTSTNYCNNARRNSDGEFTYGLHAMAIVGYEIKPTGKTHFLVQNSWGRTCPFPEDNILLESEVTCERDEDGEPTGRFWVNASTLIENSVNFTAID